MNLKVLCALKKFVKSKPLILAMPGHKGKYPFLNAKLDVTELPAIDNERVVGLAEGDCASILGAKYCRFLTGGSTAGVLSMLYAVKTYGDKIIINRNAHKSVYNGLRLLGIEPIILDCKPAYPDVDEIAISLNRKGVIGVLLTYPDYYGREYDLSRLKAECQKQNKLLIIDGAHGAHYKALGLPYAGYYADLWVDGAHKTLPTLNQGALVLCNNLELKDRLFEGVNIFSTTSPSYPLLASIEYGVKYVNEYKKSVYKVIDGIKMLKKRLETLNLAVLDNIDPYKFAVDFGGAGYNTDEVEYRLNELNVHAEMNDGRYILFMFSAFNTVRDVKKLYRVIRKAISGLSNDNAIKTPFYATVERVMPYLKATESECELTLLNDAVGKVSTDNAGLFPPCYPLVVAGEVITEQVVSALGGKNVFGVENGKIKTVRDNDER